MKPNIIYKNRVLTFFISIENKKIVHLWIMGAIKLDILDKSFQLKKVEDNFLKVSDKACAGVYVYGFQSMEKDDEIKGSTGSMYTTHFRPYDPQIGRWITPDPLAKEFPWQSPYVGFNNNPLNGTDEEGDRYIPINEVLGFYGFASREKQLFPEPTIYQKTVMVLQTAIAILDPTSPVWLSVLGVTVERGTDASNYYYKDPKNASRQNLNKYYNNLKEIDATITSEIDEVNARIEVLENEEKENGNTGFNRQEIASQTRHRWELEDRQTAVQVEIESVEPIVESPNVIEVGIGQ